MITDNYLQELNSQILTEVVKKEIDEEMKYFFPTIANSIKGLFQNFLPVLSKSLPDEEKMFKQRVSNINLNIRLNDNPMPNAYTWPSISKIRDAQIAAIPILGNIFGITNCIIWAKNSAKKMQNYTIKGDKIVFTNKFDLLAFETKGLINKIDEDGRVAILLHEVGHWAYIGNVIPGLIISTSTGLLKTVKKFQGAIVVAAPILFICNLISMLFLRQAEYDADRFVKEVGYGPALINAFDEMPKIRQNVNWYLKLQDFLMKIMIQIQNVIERFIPIAGHPSMDKRKAALADSQLTSIEKQLIYEGVVADVFKNRLRPLTLKVDAMVGKKVNLILPT